MTERDDTSDFVAASGSQVERNLDKIFGGVSADAIFHTERIGDSLVINASVIEKAGGFGFGGGGGRDRETGEGEGGGGGGGGGSALGRPVAVIRIQPDGSVSVSPVFDYTRITLTILTALIALWRALRR